MSRFEVMIASNSKNATRVDTRLLAQSWGEERLRCVWLHDDEAGMKRGCSGPKPTWRLQQPRLPIQPRGFNNLNASTINTYNLSPS